MAAKGRVYKKTRIPPLHSGLGSYFRPKLNRKRRSWVGKADNGGLFPQLMTAICQLDVGPDIPKHKAVTKPSFSSLVPDVAKHKEVPYSKLVNSVLIDEFESPIATTITTSVSAAIGGSTPISKSPILNLSHDEVLLGFNDDMSTVVVSETSTADNIICGLVDELNVVHNSMGVSTGNVEPEFHNTEGVKRAPWPDNGQSHYVQHSTCAYRPFAGSTVLGYGSAQKHGSSADDIFSDHDNPCPDPNMLQLTVQDAFCKPELGLVCPLCRLDKFEVARRALYAVITTCVGSELAIAAAPLPPEAAQEHCLVIIGGITDETNPGPDSTIVRQIPKKDEYHMSAQFLELGFHSGLSKGHMALLVDLASLCWSVYQVLLVSPLKVPVQFANPLIVYGCESSKNLCGSEWNLFEHSFVNEAMHNGLLLRSQSLSFKTDIGVSISRFTQIGTLSAEMCLVEYSKLDVLNWTNNHGLQAFSYVGDQSQRYGSCNFGGYYYQNEHYFASECFIFGDSCVGDANAVYSEDSSYTHVGNDAPGTLVKLSSESRLSLQGYHLIGINGSTMTVIDLVGETCNHTLPRHICNSIFTADLANWSVFVLALRTIVIPQYVVLLFLHILLCCSYDKKTTCKSALTTNVADVICCENQLLISVSIAEMTLCSRAQYWTSRTWTTLDVNCSESTFYSRYYRISLLRKWGAMDVNACCLCANYLMDSENVDGTRVCMTLGYASGYTTTTALAFQGTFNVGASLYGVADLIMVRKKTYSLEFHYMDYIIDHDHDFFDSSSINLHVLSYWPVMFFHGLDDMIILNTLLLRYLSDTLLSRSNGVVLMTIMHVMEYFHNDMLFLAMNVSALCAPFHALVWKLFPLSSMADVQVLRPVVAQVSRVDCTIMVLLLTSINQLISLKYKQQNHAIRYGDLYKGNHGSHIHCYPYSIDLMITWFIAFAFVTIAYGDIALVPKKIFSIPMQSAGALLIILSWLVIKDYGLAFTAASLRTTHLQIMEASVVAMMLCPNAIMGSLEAGKQSHAALCKATIDGFAHVASTLISIYLQCGISLSSINEVCFVENTQFERLSSQLYRTTILSCCNAIPSSMQESWSTPLALMKILLANLFAIEHDGEFAHNLEIPLPFAGTELKAIVKSSDVPLLSVDNLTDQLVEIDVLGMNFSPPFSKLLASCATYKCMGDVFYLLPAVPAIFVLP